MMHLLKHCVLCPWKCGVDRTAGETGFCGLPDRLVIDCALPHLGEEPPLSGRHGSGTIFFSSCNLRCCFCQNHQISHSTAGKSISPSRLARIMLELEQEGCHNINAVTPTPQAPLILEALRLARRRGLAIPLVYNSSGFEDAGIVARLAGHVDIYLPDFKYGNNETARLLSGAGHYVEVAIEALKEMAGQVGEDLRLQDDIATGGLLIRHLVLPGFVENSLSALDLIRKHLSANVTLSIMSQYTPIPAMRHHMQMGRRVTTEEYRAVVDHALQLGFEDLYIQEVDDRHLSPDFEQEMPFQWHEDPPGSSH